MIRVVFLLCLCLLPAVSQEAGPPSSELRVSIALGQKAPGIEGMPLELKVIEVMIDNTGNAPRSLVVGTNFNNADHWNIAANLKKRDGTVVALSRLPPGFTAIGVVGAVVADIAAHGSYRVLLDARNFEYVEGDGHTNLEGIVGASGDQLQIVVHCSSAGWNGDLESGWLPI